MNKKNCKVWQRLLTEASQQIEKEPTLASYLNEIIISHKTFEDALSFHLANKLQTATLRDMVIRELILECLSGNPSVCLSVQNDLEAILERDAATNTYIIPFLYFKGFHALQAYRIANWLWTNDRRILAFHFQSIISELFGVDIHPAAKIGSGIFIDHATSVVIGETAVVEDNVSILHEVTLGGTGKEDGDRHPKIGRGVLIGAGAKILGNIKVGKGSKVGAGSVVINDVPEHSTVVGVPAKVVGITKVDCPAFEMNHLIQSQNMKK